MTFRRRAGAAHGPRAGVISSQDKGGTAIATYGYARVSTKEQNVARQLLALRELGVEEQFIYVDHQSGKDFAREQYLKLLEVVRPGDLVCVKSIDRLGRDYEEIQNQWRALTREKKVDVCIVDMPLLDTRQGKDLVGTLISDLVLQLLSFVAENERHNILQRQAEGIAAAKTRGVRFGRPSLPLPKKFPAVWQRWKEGKISGTAAARACKMSLSTFRYRAARYEEVVDVHFS